MIRIDKPDVGAYVICDTCGREKAPVGRSTPPVLAADYCDSDTCEGYYDDPRPQDLFPGETREDFGYE